MRLRSAWGIGTGYSLRNTRRRKDGAENGFRRGISIGGVCELNQSPSRELGEHLVAVGMLGLAGHNIVERHGRARALEHLAQPLGDRVH